MVGILSDSFNKLDFIWLVSFLELSPIYRPPPSQLPSRQTYRPQDPPISPILMQIRFIPWRRAPLASFQNNTLIIHLLLKVLKLVNRTDTLRVRTLELAVRFVSLVIGCCDLFSCLLVLNNQLFDSGLGASEVFLQRCLGNLELVNGFGEGAVLGSQGLVHLHLCVVLSLEAGNLSVALDDLLLVVCNASVELGDGRVGSIKLLSEVALLPHENLNLVLCLFQDLANLLILSHILLDPLIEFGDLIAESLHILVGLLELLLQLFDLGFRGAAVAGEILNSLLEVGDLGFLGLDLFELDVVIGIQGGKVL